MRVFSNEKQLAPSRTELVIAVTNDGLSNLIGLGLAIPVLRDMAKARHANTYENYKPTYFQKIQARG